MSDESTREATDEVETDTNPAADAAEATEVAAPESTQAPASETDEQTAAPETAEVAAPETDEPAAETPASPDDTEDDAQDQQPEGAGMPSFGLVFQAPDLTDLPKRRSRRATSASTAPTPAPAADTPSAAAQEQDDSGTGPSDDDGGDDEQGGRGRRRRRRGGKGRRGRSEDQDGGQDGGANQTDTADEKAGDEGGDQDRSSSKGSGGGRRRRGGGDSGDGSGKGGQKEGPGKDSGKKDGADGSADSSSSDGGNDGDGGGSTKRRRRRSRSGSERPAAKDEVTSVKGSTRLEAKRQRRREGREAGRRRTVITEAEFLARRESVERVMVVRGLEDRTQIAVLEDGVPVEHYVSRSAQSTMVGNVYLGRVQNVLPSMEAAFVDIGKGRNAVLYAGEVNWDAAGLEGNQPKRIENALKSGESVLVQVTKDPIGHKGARLTSQVSLPGRYLVYVPGNSMTGISRKLPDTERARLKKILKEVVPGDAGVIVRTAAEGASEAELRADVERLTAMWEKIEAKSKTANAPALLHGEPDMTVRVIRDVFNEDFAKLVVSGDKAWGEVKRYIDDVAPDLAERVEKYTGTTDVFTTHRVHEAIAKAMDRKVWLPSGGSLVIDRTEAMTVVDVNTGKFTGSGGNLEETVTKNNIEAAEEIVRQLRLRDIGGIIVVDFIDMVLESNRDLVVRRLLECLGRDRTKHQVAEVTSLGLVQMTRKRVGSGLIEVFSESCTHCSGRGVIVQSEPVVRSGGDDGGSNGNNGGGGSKRRGKGRGKSAGAAEPKNVLPTPNPNGPTPAQIAAAAHAAALTAGASSEAADAAAQAAAVEVAEDAVPQEAVAPTVEAEPQQVTAPATEPEPEKPATEPETAEPATEPDAAQDVAPAPEPVVEPEPEPRPKRRRRGRVVSPAGPPTGEVAGEPTADAEQPADGSSQDPS
ncbi:Cytoplasmic axial filament protein CafA and Ribonuclease G [Serinicoccus hydrothermalis]|uniref:Ribonuclease E n=1 Tax=Serinicoccus hydrothermalis TaxID=1758689 RepID=A0A1B1N7N8_9MICO|nr:Rne/Rng family ribonuclease [Serinicoccus hydrothermalis]ANS77431.1 Cytoplasmic axial filament protein CafA and Ribonuclease G [Serinicoccus hydrothermalis]